MTTFVDTNILIYVLDPTAAMHQWSLEQFEACKLNGPALVTDIVYCEFSIGMGTKSEADEAINELAIERFDYSDDILFRAGQAFKRYKAEHEGPKLNVLPDFLIGASAEIAGAPLLTANKKDFLTYFPQLELIAPPDED